VSELSISLLTFMATRLGVGVALTVILGCSVSNAQTSAGSAAYCIQFKDYQDQQQCIRDAAKRSVDGMIEKCKQFARVEDRMLCWKDLASKDGRQLDAYCLPITDRQISAIRAGRKVIVAGVQGCSQIWN
jgi:hypothetical protein